jgi:hypothetical protein
MQATALWARKLMVNEKEFLNGCRETHVALVRVISHSLEFVAILHRPHGKHLFGTCRIGWLR